MENTTNYIFIQEKFPEHQQHEDAALKTCMQFFADELLPYFGISGRVKGFPKTELVHLDIRKLFQDFNFVMEDGSWKHFEFQSTNEGLRGLRRFRVYESLTSYQHNVPVTTYVLFSGSIKDPITDFEEGINYYQVIPIIMNEHNADAYIANLEQKIKTGETITKKDLVPLTLCSLMGGTLTQAERIKAAYKITSAATQIDAEDLRRIEAVIYAMADKFLDSDELKQIMEDISMTRLGKMILEKGKKEGIEEGIEKGEEKAKLENARNLIGLLDEKLIAERIGLPLETVQKLKDEIANEK